MRQLSIHVTDLCNSKCTFCVVASPLYARDEVDWTSIDHFLVENCEQGFEAVNLHGGEPTILPGLVDLVRRIRRLGYPAVEVQTNGIRLDEPAYVDALAKAGVTRFVVSLHASVPAVQDVMTHTPGGFVRTLRGIANAADRGIPVRTNTVVTRQNSGSLSEIAGLCISLGVAHANISALHPVGSSMFSIGRTLPRMTDVAGAVNAAVARLAAAGLEVTLEGFPYCLLPEGLGRHVDRERRDIRMLMRGHVIESYDDFMNDRMRRHCAACAECVYRGICGGLYPEYAAVHGTGEVRPMLPV